MEFCTTQPNFLTVTVQIESIMIYILTLTSKKTTTKMFCNLLQSTDDLVRMGQYIDLIEHATQQFCL